METKDYLTNETISKRFDNQFDLVNYAIRVAGDMIHSGRGPRVKIQTGNPALQTLAEIVAGKDKLEDSEDKKTTKTFLHEYRDLHKRTSSLETKIHEEISR